MIQSKQYISSLKLTHNCSTRALSVEPVILWSGVKNFQDPTTNYLASSFSDEPFTLPQWYISLNEMPYFGNVWYIKLVAQHVSSMNITLQYLGLLSLKHWDELTAFSNSRWTDLYPSNIDIKLVEVFSQLELTNSYVVDGSLFPLKYLDTIMIFRIHIDASTNNTLPVAQISSDVHVKVCVDCIGLQKLKDNITHETVSKMDSHIVNRIILRCNQLFTNGQCSSLVSSFLLSGPQGSGKSHLIDYIYSICQSKYNDSNLLVLKYSLNNINHIYTREQTRTQHASVVTLLISLLQLVSNSNSEILTIKQKQQEASQINSSDKLKIILILDDLDSILSLYQENIDEIESNNINAEAKSAYELIGFYLHQLLNLLKSSDYSNTFINDNNNNIIELIVIGTTRIDISQLPRSHRGAPEFESVMIIPKLSMNDREEMYTSLLSNNSLPYSLEDIVLSSSNNNDNLDHRTNDDNILEWATKLAGLTAGYLPGDIHSIMQKALLLHRGKSLLRNSDYNDNNINVLQWSTMLEAVLSQTPKQLQQLNVQSTMNINTGSNSNNSNSSQQSNSKLTWNDFAGYHEMKKRLKRILSPLLLSMNSNHHSNNSNIVSFKDNNRSENQNLQVFNKMPRGIVLHGASGCGKTYLARVIASETNMNFVSIRSTEILSKYFGQTESSIRNIFQKARAAAPCLLFFDEFDTLAYKRSNSDGGSSSGLQNRILSTFLNELDGIMSKDMTYENTVLVLAACNHISNIDEALLRPGRLQHHIELTIPTKQDITDILSLHLSRLPREVDRRKDIKDCDSHSDNENGDMAVVIDIDIFAELFLRRKSNCATVESLVSNAMLIAVRNDIRRLENNMKTMKKVTLNDFVTAAAEIFGMTQESIINEMEAIKTLQKTIFQWNGDFNSGSSFS